MVYFFSSLKTHYSIFVTHHSSLKNTPISNNSVCGLFGWNILLSFSIQKLTFMSIIGSHKYQLQIWCIERSPILPALSLSLSSSCPFHPKTIPNFRNPKLAKYQNLSAQKPSIINRSDAHLPHLEPICAISQFLSTFGPGLRISLPLTSSPPLR